ncbi:MAG: L-serine ammonia-lyase, iron-sulfur-dependent, subunit alpha [Lachnospiraceae bacterium]
MELTYKSLKEMVNTATQFDMTISELVLIEQASQMECSKADLYDKMERQYDVMISSVEAGLQPGVKSTSGLTGGDAYKLYEKRKKGETQFGSFFSGALMRAVSVSEVNASMGKIVASPTAGSCGIVPSAIITMQEEKGIQKEVCIKALFTASAVGMVIANNASLSGAQGGCQAECGSASAMAAAALVEMAGGTPKMAEHAVGIAIQNILGLVCDPVAGLVEIPCIKRNASGVANALVAAELALAGIVSEIPADEVIITMKRVGDVLPSSLKETAEGGLASTPTGERFCRQVFGH